MNRTVALLAVMLMTLTASAQADKYDLNHDGKVNVTDAMIIIRYITSGETPSPDASDKLRKITFEVAEHPLTANNGAQKAGMRKAPEVTTSTLDMFYINMTYYDDSFWWPMDPYDPENRTETYRTENGYYQNHGYWPIDNLDQDVNIYGYHLNYKANTSYFDMNDETGESFLKVTTEESSNDQCDVVVAKATETWNHCEGKVRLDFHHICSALKFSVKKTASLTDYTVEVNQIKLYNIPNVGRYSLDHNTWTLENALSNYTLQGYKNGSLGAITVTEESEQALGKSDNDYLFLIPQTIEGMAKGTPTATANANRQAYLEIQCKIHDKDGNYKVGNGQGYGVVYLPFSATLVQGHIHPYVINIGTAIRDANGLKII